MCKLGETPLGISVDEANFGIYLSKLVGDLAFNPLFVRLPFAIIGLVTIPLLYYFLYKVSGNFKLSFFVTLIFALSPWHIQESRILSYGVILVFIFLIFLFFCRNHLKLISQINYKVITCLLVFLVSLSIVNIPENIKEKVDFQRNLVSGTMNPILVEIFSNKLVESYRHSQKLVFEEIDFGNYFFAGYPRQRWGVEEAQKFLPSILLLFLIGFFVVNQKSLKNLVLLSLICILIIVFFRLTGTSYTLPLALPVSFLTGTVLSKIKDKLVLVIFGILYTLELSFFLVNYFTHQGESRFSPRRPVFASLVSEVVEYGKFEDKVFVSSKLINPEPFFKYYSKNQLPDYFEFGDIDYTKNYTMGARSGQLFVDILPDDASPSEILYKENGNWPDGFYIKSEFRDPNKNFTIVVFKRW